VRSLSRGIDLCGGDREAGRISPYPDLVFRLDDRRRDVKIAGSALRSRS
jgi:hypothetical protein